MKHTMLAFPLYTVLLAAQPAAPVAPESTRPPADNDRTLRRLGPNEIPRVSIRAGISRF
jgi:hypothetical protein